MQKFARKTINLTFQWNSHNYKLQLEIQIQSTINKINKTLIRKKCEIKKGLIMKRTNQNYA